MVFSTSWYQLPLGDEVWSEFSLHEQRYGAHAGDIETSLMLYIDPNRVRMQYAQNFHSASEQRSADYKILGDGRSAKLGWHIQDYNTNGAVGNAKAATPEKGAKILKCAGLKLSELFEELIAIPALTKL